LIVQGESFKIAPRCPTFILTVYQAGHVEMDNYNLSYNVPVRINRKFEFRILIKKLRVGIQLLRVGSKLLRVRFSAYDDLLSMPTKGSDCTPIWLRTKYSR